MSCSAKRASKCDNRHVRSAFARQGFEEAVCPGQDRCNPLNPGAGLIIPDHKIVGLYGAATLKPYRGRGLQTAIVQRRMQVAAQAGCEYAVIVTQGGTTSMRNAERLGFTLAYSKATLIKEPPAV